MREALWAVKQDVAAFDFNSHGTRDLQLVSRAAGDFRAIVGAAGRRCLWVNARA
jgi:hypothetical protein